MGKSFKLLVIDDSQETLIALGKYFEKKNYDVVTAQDGLAALKLLKADRNGFDLVITDLVMPYVSGIGLISILKKEFPHTPVIAITGWGVHPGSLAVEAHADVVLEKPFDLFNLEQLIASLLNDADSPISTTEDTPS